MHMHPAAQVIENAASHIPLIKAAVQALAGSAPLVLVVVTVAAIATAGAGATEVVTTGGSTVTLGLRSSRTTHNTART
eukprot:CAMPEP_0171073344 /NCGR_PEP_ID=MMETSP0766_2-20121228/11451_1 /TAXON_ID=439317 /ORGANISM="Gambierdiscus australes, Strain CAWD 149" /LENGTH=77 /DNA_ID=CAMNT_0011530025 /DNA_START=1 /DNA_END=231 /DNA_ORIENTATION=-